MNEEEQNIFKEEREILKEERNLLQVLNENVMKLGSAIERARIDEYTSMLTRPWRFFFFNFAVGVFRGLGIAVGMTVVAAIVLYFLAKILVTMVDLPIIGMYIGEIVKFVNQYINQGIPGR